MSEDHGIVVQPNEKPLFLGVTPGDTVVVFERKAVTDSSVSDWFMATVVFVEGSARARKAPSLFQVADIDTGIVSPIQTPSPNSMFEVMTRVSPGNEHAHFKRNRPIVLLTICS